MIEDEEFFAWLDGELDEAASARVAAHVAGNAELNALAETHRALAADLKAAFAPVADASIPPALAALLQPRGNVADFAQARAARKTSHSIPWPRWGALAATLCVGFAVGALSTRGADGPVMRQGDRLIARGAIAHALDTKLASAQAGDGVRVGVTFRASDGAICRSFSGDGASGLACRETGRWSVKGLFGGPVPGGDYRMAAGNDPALASLIDATIAGEPFDAAEERTARDSGWK